MERVAARSLGIGKLSRPTSKFFAEYVNEPMIGLAVDVGMPAARRPFPSLLC